MPDEASNDPLQTLIHEARQGSGHVLGRLLESFRPYLLQVAFEEVESDLQVKESPSDLVQKSFLEASFGFAGFQGGSPHVLKAWLRQILLNNIQDLRTRYRGGKRQIEREVPGLTEGQGPQLPGDVTPPSQNAIHNEQALAMEAGMGKLAEEARLVIKLRHRDGLSFQDIAARLNITEDATRKRWARAVEELRGLVGDDASPQH